MDLNLFNEYIKEINLETPPQDIQNYIPYIWSSNWKSFTNREKQIIVVMAKMQTEE